MRAYSKPLLLGILFLSLLQLISDFIESIYAFGLLVTSFTIEVASILLFFSPLILVFFRRGFKRPALLGLAILGLACRAVEPWLAGIKPAVLAIIARPPPSRAATQRGARYCPF